MTDLNTQDLDEQITADTRDTNEYDRKTDQKNEFLDEHIAWIEEGCINEIISEADRDHLVKIFKDLKT